jgi:endonuclease/exonuclease/phosphatase (EEP) superfamily protein YafD
MKGIEKFLWFLYKCFVFYTFLVYALILWIPFDGWVAGFMMMSFPAAILVHLISVPIWFLINRRRALWPVITVVVGCIFLPRTFAFGKKHNANESQEQTFKVMSYNAHVFMLNADRRNAENREQIGKMKDWIAESGADILCLPEFYDEDIKLFRTTSHFRNAGFKHVVKMKKTRRVKEKQYWGLALFSKFPIIGSKDTVFQAQNGMIRADIKVGNDTVRVIALHLYSMTLNLSKLAHQKQVDGVVREGKFTFAKMKDGFKMRSREVGALESWARSSPYPVILCGDFNEIPYGYVYGRLRQKYANAFEEKGSGFGFTFNHIPYFIRIDHQFYDQAKLKLEDFQTFRNVKYSDHYPLMGTYQFSGK